MSMEFYKLFNNITFTECCQRYKTKYKLLKNSLPDLQEMVTFGYFKDELSSLLILNITKGVLRGPPLGMLLANFC